MSTFEEEKKDDTTLRSFQYPLHSGFSAASTATEVLGSIDLSGITALVTGGYSGLGLETTRVLANAGATVIVPARDLRKAQDNLAGLKNVVLEKLDLMDANSIHFFVSRFLASGRALSILIN